MLIGRRKLNCAAIGQKIKRTDNAYIELNEHMEIEITAIEKNILPCTDVAIVEA